MMDFMKMKKYITVLAIRGTYDFWLDLSDSNDFLLRYVVQRERIIFHALTETDESKYLSLHEITTPHFITSVLINVSLINALSSKIAIFLH